ncbi:hypothetical protein RUM43_006067 [Polyplax serrata]|uniref:Uncharacterized protein n=1 Tax=Polyplax serrata TaxID=468196 RepID=A0AAN8P0V4_POLSC
MSSADIALKSVCQLLNLTSAEEVESVISRIEVAFQAEAAAFQQAQVPAKGPTGHQNVQTSSTPKEEDTVDGHPETPTDIQDIDGFRS